MRVVFFLASAGFAAATGVGAEGCPAAGACLDAVGAAGFGATEATGFGAAAAGFGVAAAAGLGAAGDVCTGAPGAAAMVGASDTASFSACLAETEASADGGDTSILGALGVSEKPVVGTRGEPDAAGAAGAAG